ncbi:SGNH/GDSL hydrolase family protein [Mucilaginibacter sp. PAMB04168]|uniref:SGNH/GDSL hydrolase family protein n=1 Tax=Mucilaginibacter sp. PAMB04168 TaxID=3138567 RepID=UPI0031F70213
MRNLSLTLLIITALMGCSGKNMDDVQYGSVPTIVPGTTFTGDGSAVSYLALGDSYTIGESVPAAQSFPYQLSAALNKANYKAAQPVIIARTGWTTDELINEIKAQNITRKFDIVTLLIGVNNQYRNYNINTYRTEFVQLLNTALIYANGNKKRVFVISIPDWGVTPFGQGRDRTQIAKEINAYNAINKEESDKAGVSYTNITPISRQAIADPTLVASDGLHPSGRMYMLWVDMLVNEVAKNLQVK